MDNNPEEKQKNSIANILCKLGGGVKNASRIAPENRRNFLHRIKENTEPESYDKTQNREPKDSPLIAKL